MERERQAHDHRHGIGPQNALIAQTTGGDGIPVIAWSQSGAPALLVTQDTHFDNPALAVYRSGTAGNTTTSPTMLVQAGLETTGTTPVLQVGGCLAFSGDNWYIVWGDGSLSLPGGFLDNTGKTKGNLSIDPVHRQLVAEDGVTPVLSWAGGGVSSTVRTKVVPGDYTISTADNGCMLRVTAAATLTLPAFPVGFNVGIIQEGAGQVVFSSASGVSLLQRQGFTKTAGQYAVATLIVNTTNSYVLGGDTSN